MISGPRYDPETDSVKIVCKHRPNKQENLERIEKMFARLIVAAKVCFTFQLADTSSFVHYYFILLSFFFVQDKTETFHDLTVEGTVSLSRKPLKPKLAYPESWKIFKKPAAQ